MEIFDALVIGAGAGGMVAAGLNHHGYRTLLVETRDRVGGRAPTMDIALLRADLRENFLDLDGARELSVEVCAAGRWPGQCATAGHDLPNDTPIDNLWNIGDGVRAWADQGQGGCVSARMVVEAIRCQYPTTALRAQTGA